MLSSEIGSSRIAITGFASHGPFGDSPSILAAIHHGKSAIEKLPPARLGGHCSVWGAPSAPVSLVGLLDNRKLHKYMNPSTELAVLTVGKALQSSGLFKDEQRLSSTALFLSTGLIAFDLSEVEAALRAAADSTGVLDLKRLGADALSLCHPLMPFKMLLNTPVGLSSIVYGIRGENAVYYPLASQGAAAIDSGFRGIRAGRFSHAVVGGCAQNLSLLPLSTFSSKGLLTSDKAFCQPYSTHHLGLALADAAAVVILESESEAHHRGISANLFIDDLLIAQSPLADRQHQWSLRYELFRELAQGQTIDCIVSSGNRDHSDDLDEHRSIASIWPQNAPSLLCADGSIGFASSAAMPLSLVLASEALRQGVSIDNSDLSPKVTSRTGAAKAIVSVMDHEGGCAALRLSFDGVNS